jgi:hypothetical protein
MLPDGFSAEEIVKGTADLKSMLPAEPRAFEGLRFDR